MGYDTTFTGSFKLNKKLDDELHAFLNKFAQTRRMKRKLGPEYGIEGEYYVDGKGFMGQDLDDNVVDSNRPPAAQPSLWCQWIPDSSGTQIEWDGGEKFYFYTKWIEYIIEHFLAPKSYVLNGEVYFQGEDSEDKGVINIQENKVSTVRLKPGDVYRNYTA